MSNEAFYITAKELSALGKDNIPPELKSSENLIYSSPATLAFNSPGAQGFGVKRAGLAVPESVMLLVSPGCCGRNTAALGRDRKYADRFYYLLQDDTDIVTGRHLSRIPEAVKEICSSRPVPPKAVMICITCVDALLGTDMDRVCRKCTEAAGVPVVPCYMYALTREGRLPPMASVRRSVYSLLKKRPRKSNACNILGYFSPLADDCELYELLQSSGVKYIREISRMQSFAEYELMAEANFNLVLNSEARYAAQDMFKNLEIPFIELNNLHRADKIHAQYTALAQALDVRFNDEKYYSETLENIDNFKSKYGCLRFAVGEWLNADSFELALSLAEMGLQVSEIYGTIGESNFVYLKKLAMLSPDTRIYSNLSPTMLYYNGKAAAVDFAIGQDAMYYHAGKPGIKWNSEVRQFGYQAINDLLSSVTEALL
ncbi:MAG: oxidoreductase [Lentisphaerae bacterium]|nr:oxidoreductase [Lentisphaerota bacterium]